MAAGSKRLILDTVAGPSPGLGSERTLERGVLIGEVGLVFISIMIAVWAPRGVVNTGFSVLAVLCVLWFTARAGYSWRELGFSRPRAGTVVILALGTLMVLTIVASGWLVRGFGPAQPVPGERAWKYALWALEQESILQSFFYVRLESLLGSRRGVWGAAFLFCLAHLPSPVLTLMSLIGGLLFCEMFRRYRNIFPLGLVHGALGLTIAASLPDRWLHHMRVGLGYLSCRP